MSLGRTERCTVSGALRGSLKLTERPVWHQYHVVMDASHVFVQAHPQLVVRQQRTPASNTSRLQHQDAA